jgi:hypothetical protein
MGFTRYWSVLIDDPNQINKTIKKDQWLDILTFSKNAIDLFNKLSCQKSICGAKGVGESYLGLDGIKLNGNKLVNDNLDTFSFPRTMESNVVYFCKTGRKRYDIVVTSILRYVNKKGIIKFTEYNDDQNPEILNEFYSRITRKQKIQKI